MEVLIRRPIVYSVYNSYILFFFCLTCSVLSLPLQLYNNDDKNKQAYNLQIIECTLEGVFPAFSSRGHLIPVWSAPSCRKAGGVSVFFGLAVWIWTRGQERTRACDWMGEWEFSLGITCLWSTRERLGVRVCWAPCALLSFRLTQVRRRSSSVIHAYLDDRYVAYRIHVNISVLFNHRGNPGLRPERGSEE